MPARQDVTAGGRPAPGGGQKRIAGRYRLEELLGAGGSGAVWRATDQALGRAVAIKLLHPSLERDDDTLARLRQEAASAAKLTHPNAVVLYDLVEGDGRMCLVMELVEGPTLAGLLRPGPLRPDLVTSIGLDVARALGGAHALGLIHRDVKPANVLLGRDGTAKMADFGIAKALGDAQSRLTRAGSVMGTAAYLAPEQVEGKAIDARADVYALGLMLHESLTGQRPFGAGTAVELATRRLAIDPPAPRDVDADVPPALNALIVRATRREPDERFADGAAFAVALEPLLAPDTRNRVAAAVAAVRPRPSLPGHVAARQDDDRPTAVDPTQTRATPVPGDARRASIPADTSDSTAALEAVTSDPTTTIPTPGRSSAGHTDRPIGPPGSRATTSQARWVVLVAILGAALITLGVAAAVVAIWGDDETRSPATESTPTAGPGGQAAAPPLLDIAAASDHDPLGDGREHPDEVADAHDGDPDSAWTSEGYDSADLGGIKPGVGIWFDLGDTHAVAEVQLELGPGGTALEIYAATEPDEDGIDGWGDPVATVDDVEGDARIEVNGVEGRYWLVWVTSVPPPADGGRHRAVLAEARFVADAVP